MALKDTIEKAKDIAKKMGVSDKTINTVAGTTEKVATAMSNANKESSSGGSSGGDMVIHPKASIGGRLSKYGTNSSLGTPTDYGTYEQDLSRLTAAQRQAQVDELKAAKRKALASLDAQEQNIKPMYQTARNQTSAASQQGARNFAEYLANRGLTNSGAAAQGEINRLSNLQNNLGNINTAEANAFRDIANQRTAVENNYVSSLANANNALTNNYYNNLLNYNEQQRQMVQALQNQALGQYSDDYQAYKNNLIAQGYDPNSLEVLRVDAARGNKVYNANNNAYTYQNALNNIASGNYSYNDLLAAGMNQTQADKYRADILAAQQAQAQKERDAQLWERQQYNDKMAQQNWQNEYNLAKLANETAQTNYNVNKPYNSTVYHVSNGGSSKESTPKTNYLSFDKALDIIANSDDPQATTNALAAYGYVDEGFWNYMYDINHWNMN